MLSLLTFDLADGLADPRPIGVAVEGSTVYGNGKSLYVTGTRPRAFAGRGRPVERTDVHKISLAGDGYPEYAASGSVPGGPPNQYAMSEHGGDLRIATTSRPGDAETSSSAVRVLRRSGPRLGEIGRAQVPGRPSASTRSASPGRPPTS